MDAIRHIIATSGLHPGAGSDSGIDGCTSSTTGSCCGSSASQIQPTNANHSHSEATSAALHDDSDVNLPVDDSPLTEDEAVSDDDECPHDDVDVLDNGLEVQITPGESVDNNRLFQTQIGATHSGCGSGIRLSERSVRLSSKEEKQRQNEEIVIMESSSVSSETGSWESVFPQRTPSVPAGLEPAAVCTLTEGASTDTPKPDAPEPVTVRGKEKQRLPEFAFSSKPMCSAAAACFIDASSLMDDTEMYACQNEPHLPEVGCCGPKPPSDESTEDPDLHSPNLSDEQKLLHRAVPELTDSYDIKDQFSLGSQLTHSSSESPPDSTIPSSQDEGISIPTNSDPECRIRQDLERKQGHFLFRNSIQHYSGNVVAPHRISSGFHDDNHSDLSLPSIYSTGSGEYGQPYASLGSNFGDYGGATSDAESGFYPDTPHNSIIHIETPVPTRPVPAVRSQPADQVCRAQEEKPAEIRHTPFDSPSVRRKTETCPILSGGLQSDDIALEQKKPVREKPISSSMNSWVVDMSDCNQSPKASDSEVTPRTARSLDPKRFATGFYVDMSDSDCSLPPSNTETKVKDSSEDKKNLFSMFIDFGEKKIVTRKDPASFTSRLSSSILKQRELANSSDTESDREQKTPSSSFIRRTPASVRRNPPDPKNRHSWNEPPPSKLIPSSIASANPRQYNSSVSMPDGDNGNSIMSIFDKIPSLLGTKVATTSSMSIDSPISPYDDLTSCKSMSAYSNNSGKSLNTSHSVHSSVDDVAAGAPSNDKPSARRRRQDVEINETFDKSSRSSLPEEVLSTDDSSPITDTDDVTFQNDLELDQPEAVPEVEATHVEQPPDVPSTVSATEPPEHTMESLQAIIERQQKLLLETVAEELPSEAAAASTFVKLSDMDKPVPKFELHDGAQLSKSVGSTTNRIERLFADSAKQSRSRNPWHTMSRSTGNNNLTTLASSSDNLKSLSRLFPHLSKELSSSLPSDIQQQTHIDKAASPEAGQYKSPGGQDSNYYCADGGQDLSAASSVTSSFSRSAIDSADESSLSYRQPRRLGEDLLKMFLQEIATDVTLEVGGRKMRAHKCILRSRCQYFAAILAGNWVQSAGNVITIAGYSFDSVHFALCHIYSGAAHPPEGISLIELAALADLLGLEGLKEVTAYALRMQYCHNFHKPCSGCLDGILRVFPVTLSYGLDELYRKCLRWTCKHYVSVWPTRHFADLPADIIGRCSQHLVAHMNSETVLDTILDCELILSLVVRNRWAMHIENTVRDIIDMAHAYLSDHFASLVASDGFLSLGQDKYYNILRLENLILRTASTLTPEQACRSYQRITRLHAVLLKSRIGSSHDETHTVETDTRIQHHRTLDEDINWKPEFLRLVEDVLNAVEHCLVGQCGRAMRTNQWQRMDLELRKKMQHMAGLSDPPPGSESRRSGSQLVKPLVYHSASSSSIGSYSNNNSTKRSQDLYAVKLAIQAQSKRAQDSQNRYREHHQSNRTASNQPHPPERPTTLHLRPERSHNVWSTTHESRAPDRGTSERSSIRSVPKVSVPDVVPKTSASKPSHRRTQSESNPIKSNSRLGEIRPRYMEPKQHVPPPQQRSVSTTSANLLSAVNIADVNLSSSGESSTRNSKLALNKRLASSSKSNMSRDSLASPIKQPLKTQPKQTASEVDLSIDSLGGSMHSSVKSRSNKSMSQESLVRFNANVRANNLQSTTAHKVTTSRLRQPSTNALSSAEHSPCSMTTNTTATKSSRLSSVNSATSSPRDLALRRTGVPPPQASIRRSFVSAKSREILAAKQNSLNRAESTKSVPNSTSLAPGNTVNKSNSTSSMMNKRPVSFPTTLHLRRTAKLSPQPPNGVEATSAKSVKSPFPTGRTRVTESKSKTDINKSSVRRVEKVSSSKVDAKSIATTTNNRIKGASTSTVSKATSSNSSRIGAPRDIELAVQQEDDDESEFVAPMAATRVESKLERSSTFCKESSSLDTADLQVIE